MVALIDSAGWTLDEKSGKEKFRIVIECDTEKDIPEFPISWVGKPVKVEIMLPE